VDSNSRSKMKKLENFATFNESKLSETHCSLILGGAGVAIPTGAGTRCTDWTSTGCQAYTNDSTCDGVTNYSGTSEVTNPCSPTGPGGQAGGGSTGHL
jgi:hypothetical protein